MAFQVEFCKPAIQILECEKDVEITCRLAYCDGVEETRMGCECEDLPGKNRGWNQECYLYQQH